MAEAYAQYRELRKVAATRNVLLPVGHDHNIPSRWCTEIHREWPKRYVWPRFVMGLPRDFFAAVRAELSGRRGRPAGGLAADPRHEPGLHRQGRLLHRHQAGPAGGRDAVLDAERLATLAALLGARYPARGTRQGVAAARLRRPPRRRHRHRVRPGLPGPAGRLAGGVRAGRRRPPRRRRARSPAQADTTRRRARPCWCATRCPGRATASPGSGSATRRPGPATSQIRDDDGAELPAVADGVRRHADGTLAEVDVSFLAAGVPALGYRVFRRGRGRGRGPVAGWSRGPARPRSTTTPSRSRPTRRAAARCAASSTGAPAGTCCGPAGSAGS